MAGDSEVRRLFRSENNRVVGGVLGGIGEYLNVDPVAIRVVYVLTALITGLIPLLAAYIVLLFIIPSSKK